MQLAVDKLPPNDARFSEHSADGRNHPECVSLRWACVYTHPQAERWAQATLTRRGYETWLPLVTIRRRDRVLPSLWHTVEVPAFSRYLFVRHQPGTGAHPIAYGDGIASMLKMDGKPAYLSDMAIAALQSALQAREDLVAVQHHPTRSWPLGTPCRPATGPFAGADAIVTGHRGKFVLVQLIMGTGLGTLIISPDALVARD